MTLDFASPLDILPHSYPFLLIDRVLEVEEMKRIVCLKNVTQNEVFFKGHFRNRPVVPGVLLVEMMAQTSGILLTGTQKLVVKKEAFLASIKEVKFKIPVIPGDQLKIVSVLKHYFFTFYMFEAEVYANGKLAAAGEIILAEIPKKKIKK